MVEILTAEKICDIADGSRQIINKMYREQDESNMWPISNKFNATERAIRTACRFEKDAGEMSPLEYAYFLDAELSRIVNNERNW